MYVYVYIYIYIYVYICMCIYIYIYQIDTSCLLVLAVYRDPYFVRFPLAPSRRTADEHICICVCIYIYIYIYIMCIQTSIYIYIYIYMYRGRESVFDVPLFRSWQILRVPRLATVVGRRFADTCYTII